MEHHEVIDVLFHLENRTRQKKQNNINELASQSARTQLARLSITKV